MTMTSEARRIRSPTRADHIEPGVRSASGHRLPPHCRPGASAVEQLSDLAWPVRP